MTGYRWRKRPIPVIHPAAPTGVRITRASVAMGDESEPIFLDVDHEPGARPGERHWTLRSVLDELVRYYSDGRYGWVSVGRQTTTWVLWLYPNGRLSAPGRPAAVVTCDPVAVTHLLVDETTPIEPGAVLYLSFRVYEDPDDVAASPKRPSTP